MTPEQTQRMIIRFVECKTCFVQTYDEKRYEVDGFGSRGFSVFKTDPVQFIPIAMVSAIEDPTIHLQSVEPTFTCCGRLSKEVDCAELLEEATCEHCLAAHKKFMESLIEIPTIHWTSTWQPWKTVCSLSISDVQSVDSKLEVTCQSCLKLEQKQ